MATGLMKLPENRVRRNYTGVRELTGSMERPGRRTTICRRNGWAPWWEASNPGMEPIAHEGMASGGRPRTAPGFCGT